MKSSRKISLALSALATCMTHGYARMDTEGPAVVGSLHTIHISSNDAETQIPPLKFSVNNGTQTMQGRTYILSHLNDNDKKEASYIALHFANFDLHPFCTMEITDSKRTSKSSTILTGKGRSGEGTFWAKHINDSSAMMMLKCDGGNALARSQFQIDQYVAGYPIDHNAEITNNIFPRSTPGPTLPEGPTATPTTGPTNSPTNGPTSGPTYAPTEDPTAAPTGGPTSAPTSDEDPSSGPNFRSGMDSEIFTVNLNESSAISRGSSPAEHKPPTRRRNLGVCGSQDDRQSVACFRSTNGNVYQQSLAVARLLISGRFVCSGFLVAQDLLVTASSCLDDGSALEVDYEFHYQQSSCESKILTSSEIFQAVRVLEHNPTSDYSIVQLAGSPGAKYGFLEVSDTLPTLNERVYLPQHKRGFDKQIAASETCAVLTNGKGPNDRTCPFGASFKDISHSCDADGGAIGAPVVSKRTGQVVGMHHCSGDCDSNFAIPASEIRAAIDGLPETRSDSISLGLATGEDKVAQLVSSEGVECLLSINTGQCGSLVTEQLATEAPCACANFCNGNLLSCCERGKACPVTCSGELVAGCSTSSITSTERTKMGQDQNLQDSEPWDIIPKEFGSTDGPPDNKPESTGKNYHRLRRKI